MVNKKWLGSIIDNSVITFEEIIEETKATLTKTDSTNSNEKTLTQGKKILYFTHLFINYHIIIDSC